LHPIRSTKFAWRTNGKRQPHAKRSRACRLVTVGGAVAHPSASLRTGSRRRSRTGRERFPSSGSSVHEPLSQAHHWKQLLPSGAWQLRTQRWTCVRSSVRDVLNAHPSAQDPPSSCPVAFSCTGPTSAYPRHYSGPWLLGASYSLAASGRLPAHLSGVRAARGFPVPCVHFARC